MKTRNKLLAVIVCIAVILLIFYFYNNPFVENSGFKVDNIVLKSIVSEGESTVAGIKVTNLAEEQTFSAGLANLEGIASVSDTSFTLLRGESKQMEVSMTGTSAGVHTGSLVISAKSGEKKVPIILSVNSRDVLFAVSLGPGVEAKTLSPGEAASVDVRIVNLADLNKHTVEVEYAIRTFEGELVSSEKEDVVVSTELSYAKTVALPGDLPYGSYAFSVTVRSGDSVSNAGYLFTVSRKTFGLFGLFGSSSFVPLFSVLVLLFLAGIIVLTIIMMRDRDKLFKELRRHQEDETKYYMGRLAACRVAAMNKAGPSEKLRLAKKFARVKSTVIHHVKRKHAAQKAEFKKLHKMKKTGEMQRKLEEWKEKGYDTGVLTGPKSAQGQMKQWQKEGFDTSLLR